MFEQFIVDMLGQAATPDTAFEQQRGSTDTLPGLDTFSVLHFPAQTSVHDCAGPPIEPVVAELVSRNLSMVADEVFHLQV